jgi:hypothetical protein
MLEPSELAPSRPRKPLRHLLTAFAVLGCFTQSQAANLLTGGDAVDGWILPSAANVVFAVGMGTTGATLQGVTFTTSSPQLSGATSNYAATLSYSSPSADDTALATIGNRLAFSGGDRNLTMTLLTPGQTYQLDQLFTAGGYSQRSMQVFVDGDGNGTVDATPIDTLNLSNPNNVFLVRTTAIADTAGTIRVRLSAFNNTGGGGFAADGTVFSGVVLSTIPAPPVLLSFTPADGSTTPATADLVATFNEPIAIGTGNITIKNLTDTTETVITLPDSQVTVSGAVLTINPNLDLVEGKIYAIQIAAGAIKDLENAPFAGILDDTTWNFATAAATPTTTTVVSSGTPSIYGSSVTFTATVNPVPSGGTVQFYNGINYVGSPVAVNTTTGVATVSTTTLGVVGPNEITADYSGYQIYDPSTTAASITQVVGKAPLTVTANFALRLPNTANPDPLTYVITGYQNGENIGTSGVSGTPALSTTAVLASPVGSYPITCAGGDLTAVNYSFTLVDGTLSVVDALPTTLLTGGDAADGWILPSAANVVFAVGMGTTGATLQGVTFTTSSPQLSGVAGSRYGVTLSYPSPSADDTALATVGNRLAFSGGNMNLTMTILTPGQTYQLDQLFTAGGYSPRSMQVFVDGDGNGTVDATPIDTLNLSNPNNVFLVRTTAIADTAGTIRVRLTPFDNDPGGGFNPDGTVLSGVVLSTIVSSGFTTWADANAGGQTAGEDFDNDGVENGIEFFMG